MLTVEESEILAMVRDFYGRVRLDPLLGPVFEARLAGRWEPHLDKMVDFWSSALCQSRRYAGNPRATHAAIEGIDPLHFGRWLELFRATLDDLFSPERADLIHGRAQAMAGGLMRGLINTRPGLPMTE